jgi:iron complex outermembrane receptor protein
VYRRQFGDAAVERVSTLVHAEVPMGPVTLFGFADYTFRDTDAYAWTREPQSNRNVPEIYPDGFDPRITSVVQDVAGTGGLRFPVLGWNVELSNTFGLNDFDYRIKNTLNASLLAESPRSFHAGGHQFSQNVTGVQATRTFGDSAPRLAVTAGSEFRVDRFRIFAGEEGSYRNYGIVERTENGVTMLVDELGRPGGSQGFPGYRPDNVVDEIRTNAAGYASGALDVTRDLLVDLAGRFEHYSDFGGTFNVRLATRLELVDLLGIDFMHHLALRASASTGFRAPSLAQIHYNSVVTDFEGGVPRDKVIAKNSGELSRRVGIDPLREERSRNVSAGVSAQVADFRLSVDGYYVDIVDRVVLSGAFDNTDTDIGQDLMAMGVSAAQFFTNALDTTTLGIDAVLDGSVTIGRNRFRPALSANFNRMKLGAIKVTERLAGKEETFFGEREKHFLLASAPKSKIGVGLGYERGDFFANTRMVRWGGVTLIDYTDMEDVYRAKITTDVSVGWHFGDRVTLILGGNNIFNVYPTQQDTETESGGLWDAVQMGSNGAQYFAKLNARI